MSVFFTIFLKSSFANSSKFLPASKILQMKSVCIQFNLPGRKKRILFWRELALNLLEYRR